MSVSPYRLPIVCGLPPRLDDEDFPDYVDPDDRAPCLECDESGWIVNCVDDLCHGRGECMYGGELVCPVCEGSGEFTPPPPLFGQMSGGIWNGVDGGSTRA